MTPVRRPLWAAAAVAMAEGRFTQPTASPTVRPGGTYEMDVIESKAFREPHIRPDDACNVAETDTPCHTCPIGI